MVICSQCKVEKDTSEFYSSRQRQCKDCVVENVRLSRRDPSAEQRRRWSQYQHNSRIRRVYGLEPQEYESILREQDGVCAICGAGRPSSRTSRLHVDHAHGSKKVRGLLCTNCNNGLGRFKDDPELLVKAAVYLRRHGGEVT